MSEFKGTPGPWQKNYDGPSLPIITNWAHGDEIVALVRTGEADADLIAAAPDLLEALAGMLVSDNDTHRESDSRWSVFRLKAHAAIKKALGDE